VRFGASKTCGGTFIQHPAGFPVERILGGAARLRLL